MRHGALDHDIVGVNIPHGVSHGSHIAHRTGQLPRNLKSDVRRLGAEKAGTEGTNNFRTS